MTESIVFACVRLDRTDVMALLAKIDREFAMALRPAFPLSRPIQEYSLPALDAN
jgi:hypothetical protein